MIASARPSFRLEMLQVARLEATSRKLTEVQNELRRLKEKIAEGQRVGEQFQ